MGKNKIIHENKIKNMKEELISINDFESNCEGIIRNTKITFSTDEMPYFSSYRDIVNVDDIKINKNILIEDRLYKIEECRITKDGREIKLQVKCNREVSYEKINDGFIYFNFTKDSIKQMHAVLYPEQDMWYIYGMVDSDGDDRLTGVDIKTINSSEMISLLKLIDNGMNISTYLFILVETGHKGKYRCSLFNSLYPLLQDEINNYLKFDEIIPETKCISEYTFIYKLKQAEK